MSVLQEVLAWSKKLPAWQSDAVARLLAKAELSPADDADVFALLKLEHGIADPQGRIARPLSADQIPEPVRSSMQIQLVAIKDMRHVNAIAEGQRLSFAPTGLTVIYGHNGSGKSGYSRVLKRACRARDQAEPIHPDAKLPVSRPAAAEATFDILVDGDPRSVRWTDGAAAPGELSAFSVFDARCADAYLGGEDDFSYIPFGLDVFDRLAKLCVRLKGLIDTERAQHAVDLRPFAFLYGDTAVGALIRGLSSETSAEQIANLSSLSTDDLDRLASLEQSLKESQPKERATQLRLQAGRLTALASRIRAKAEQVSPAVVERLFDLTSSFHSAKQAAALAADGFKASDSLLPGTGGEAWRDLFEAARKFATKSYPDQRFPALRVGSPCPLCQQPLSEGAERLQRFEAFVQQETEKVAQASRGALIAQYQPFVAQDLGLGFDEMLHEEIKALDPDLAAEITAFEAKLKARQASVKQAVDLNQWSESFDQLVSPEARLHSVVERLNAEAETLERASDEAARVALQREAAELSARRGLAQVRDAVIATVAKLNHLGRLDQCLSAVRTQAISLKAAELADRVVSKDLADALNAEFKALDVGHLSVKLQSRTDRGKALHKLKLELPQSRSPSEILSEGEQRAIAIGSFLAEVRLSGAKGGVVFDDPVSSLDHRRRERVARRLAQEARSRQVVVFTHDIYFLSVLAEESKQAGVEILTQSIQRRAEGFGVADPELPFEGKSVSKRIGALRAQQQQIAKLFRDGNEDEHRKLTVEAYIRLRMTWERAVEEVLLHGVVLRFRKGVETQKLAAVSVGDDDYAKVSAGMSKCSNYAHDNALQAGISVPHPDELLADIDALESWRQDVEKRKTLTAKNRKSSSP